MRGSKGIFHPKARKPGLKSLSALRDKFGEFISIEAFNGFMHLQIRSEGLTVTLPTIASEILVVTSIKGLITDVASV